jgi:hypothetical protein
MNVRQPLRNQVGDREADQDACDVGPHIDEPSGAAGDEELAEFESGAVDAQTGEDLDRFEPRRTPEIAMREHETEPSPIGLEGLLSTRRRGSKR